MPRAKRVGRTVSVSRGFAWFAVFDAKKLRSQFIPVLRSPDETALRKSLLFLMTKKLLP